MLGKYRFKIPANIQCNYWREISRDFGSEVENHENSQVVSGSRSGVESHEISKAVSGSGMVNA